MTTLTSFDTVRFNAVHAQRKVAREKLEAAIAAVGVVLLLPGATLLMTWLTS